MSGEFVHVVDDDDAVREALAWLLKSAGLAVKAYGSGEDFLASGGAHAAGAILLDVRMSGMSGLEVFDALKAAAADTPVIFLTGHGDVPLAVAAIKSGAFDFLEKPFDDRALLAIVQRALESHRRARVTAESVRLCQQHLMTLSAREVEVMDLLLKGKPNKVIATNLGIAVRTVEVHRARIFEKMGVKSAVELSVLLSSRPPP